MTRLDAYKVLERLALDLHALDLHAEHGDDAEHADLGLDLDAMLDRWWYGLSPDDKAALIARGKIQPVRPGEALTAEQPDPVGGVRLVLL